MAQVPKNLTSKRLLLLIKEEKNLKSALTLFESTSRQLIYTHSASTFHHILRRFSLSHNLNILLNVTRIVDLIRIHQCQCSEDAALAFFKFYSKNLMAEKAMETFQKMREVFGCEPGVRSYNSLLSAFVVSNQLSKAEVFFRNFRSMGLSPILETFNILIKTACQKREFDKVRELIDCMWDRNLSPDRHSYGTLINELVKAGNLNEAVKVFEDMSNRGVMSDVTCCNILIDGLCKKRDLMVANGILNKLNKDSHVYPNLVTYNVMISGLCNCERFVEALELFDRMRKNERKMDIFTCSSLIHGLCVLGNVDEVERVYTEMVESKVPPESVVYNALLSGYQNVDRFEDCFKLWELMG